MNKIHIKKLIICVFFTIALFIGGDKTYANIPVIDGSNLAQNALQVAKLIQSVILEGKIDASTMLTQINTYKIMYDQTIRRPLQDAMNRITIEQSADQIINMVNGSTDGNSLLVANPEKFVKNAGLNSVQASYNLVAESKGLYSDIINENIEETTKGEDAETALASLTQSSLPATIQNDLCSDAGLTAGAENNLANQGVGSPTVGQVSTEKQNIYSQYCTKDPDSDVAFAKSLVALNARDSSAGGWDAWLLKTSGDNEFTRVSQVLPIVEEEQKDKEHFEELDVTWGGGIASEKTCVKRDSTGLCTETAVINPGSALADAFSKAKTVGLDTAVNALGTGADGSGLFGDLSDILGFVGDAYNTVNGAISSVTSGLGSLNGIGGNILATFGGTTGATDAQINSARSPSNVSVVTSSSFTANLVDNPTLKASTIAPIINILDAHLTALDNLVTTDTNYLVVANTYKNLVYGVLRCYQDIETTAVQSGRSYTRPSSITTFYNVESQATETLISRLTTEKNSGIPSTKNFIQNTRSKISNSNSTEEITYYNSDYMSKVDTGQLISSSANTTRNGEFTTYRAMVDSSQVEGGSITIKMAECATARTTSGG